MEGCLQVHEAKAIAAALVAQGYTARAYPSERIRACTKVVVLHGPMRLQIYDASDLPAVMLRLTEDATPTAVERLEAAGAPQLEERVPRGYDPFNP